MTTIKMTTIIFPPLPEPFDIWRETDDDCGAWGRPDQPIFTTVQMQKYAQETVTVNQTMVPVAYRAGGHIRENKNDLLSLGFKEEQIEALGVIPA